MKNWYIVQTFSGFEQKVAETLKDTMTGALMVFGLASIAAIFFLLLDQILRFLLNIILNLSF